MICSVNFAGFSTVGSCGSLGSVAFFQSAVSFFTSSTTCLLSKSPTMATIVLFGTNTFLWKAAQSAAVSFSTVLRDAQRRPADSGCLP